MTERSLKPVMISAAVLGAMALAYFAYLRPVYFVSQTSLAGLIFLELIFAATWLYRKTFLALVLVTFLFAGLSLRVVPGLTVGRWVVLSVGAMVGCVLIVKQRGQKFGMFHAIAAFAVLAALVSAAVSRYTYISSLKVLSLTLLFVYAGTGARLAVIGRENRFFPGLLTGCEVLVVILAAFHFAGMQVLGNPNSLGAVMGVVAAPILLWGTLLTQGSFAHKRRLFVYGLCMYLAFASHARAGILAAVVSCGLLCVALRRYALLWQGIGIIAIVAATTAIVRPEVFSSRVSDFTSTVVFKGKDPTLGVLASRDSPWQDTIDTIREHFWFGTGFGTSDVGIDATAEVGTFASGSAIAVEHGSSYLAITSWVGMAGVLPFLLLLGILIKKISQTVQWMSRTGDPGHGVVPLAMVMVAGIVHAGFEDWLFAPGYYLCVFYWTMAFIFVDQVLSISVINSRSQAWSRPQPVGADLGFVAPSR